jgi:hypothetical protein
MPYLNIAGLAVNFEIPDWAVHQYFFDFIDQACTADIHIKVLFKEPSEIPAPDGDTVFTNDQFTVTKSESTIQKRSFDREDIPYCLSSSHDWSLIELYIAPEFDNGHDEENAEFVRRSILGGMRKIMSACLAYRNGFLIHAVSIIWEDTGILFTAPSGTGKSTHAKLWVKRYGARILDGDVTACRLTADMPVISGVPWCGSSDICLNESAPLRAVVFLRQCEENKIRKLNTEEAFIRMLERCYIQRWDRQLTDITIDVVEHLAERTDCYLLDCLPNSEAAELVMRTLLENDDRSRYAGIKMEE